MFEAIVANAARLCEAEFSAVARFSEGLLHLAAISNMSPGEIEAYHSLFPRPAHRGFIIGRAFVEGRPVHVEDVREDPDYDPRTLEVLQHAAPYRTFLGIPIRRNGVTIGAIGCGRRDVRPFTPSQIELVKTFADQAVIAIENVRLFQELEVRNRDLTETLEQQTATSEILRVISASPTDIQPVLDAVAANAARLCEASDAQIYRADGDSLRLVASFGSLPTYAGGPINRGWVTGRSVVDRRTTHVHDIAAESEAEYPIGRDTQRTTRHRTTLATPLLREGRPLGAILIRRTEVRLFSDKQIKLLETFADQAVIAIENVRLFTELGARNRDLTETLEQQTATGEILRVISGSPTDVQPVFDTIAESAARLCDAFDVVIMRRDGDRVRLAAHHGPIPAGTPGEFTLPLDRATVAGRSILEAQTLHIADLQTEEAEYPGSVAHARRFGFRAILSAPLMRGGVALGAIHLRRVDAVLFSERQVALLKTFADQAVIAIENVRLFQELDARNRDLSETLEQQTATGEILRVISSSPTDVQPVFDIIGESAEKLCDAAISVVSRFDGDLIHMVSLHGVAPEGIKAIRDAFPMRVDDETVSARAVRARAVVHVSDVLADPQYQQKGAARAGGYRGCLAVPMVRENQVIGAIFVARTTPGLFTDTQVELLKTFADQAVIAVENVRLFTELGARNRDLTETLEQQTATAEILRVISSSPTELQPVMNAVAESAARLCEAANAVVWQRDGERLRVVASHGGLPMARTELTISRQSVGGRAVIDRRAVHVEDLAEALDRDFPDSRPMKELGYRTILVMPLMREGEAIGIILIRRTEVRLFSSRQVALLQTFADQAVIAIENVRLFKELEVRNRDLTETLEQQTATGEILRAISASPTNVQPVFDTIAQSARRLCGAEFCQVFRAEAGQLHNVANDGQDAEGLTAIRRAFPRPVDQGTAAGRAVLGGVVAQIPDAQTDPTFTLGAVARAVTFRSLVAVPIMREGIPIGAIAVARATPGLFPDRQVQLLKLFADQAVIAIENVRMFAELGARNHDLTETLEQQTATSEILRVISSSPTDVQPVFDTIAESAAQLCDALAASVFPFDGDMLHVGTVRGPGRAQLLRAWSDFFPYRPGPEVAIGQAVLERRIIHIPDVLALPGNPLRTATQRASGHRAYLAVPMMRDGSVVGILACWRAEAGLFSDRQVDLLKTFADQAVIAIENVRLFKELEARNHDLTETLEQQTATGEILRVISSSPTDVQPVFDSIATSAKRLCEAEFCFVFRLDGTVLHFAAQHGLSAEGNAAMHTVWPAEIDRGSAAGRSILDRAIVHIPDVRTDPDYRQASVAEIAKFRSVLGVPMLRDGVPIGTMTVNRSQAGPFPDRQIELLKTFADQAVIAVENVRLFKELDVRNRDLTETLEQQTATGEILRVISSSPTDVQPVFDSIAASAKRLCEAEFCHIFRFDGTLLHFVGHHGLEPEGIEAIRRAYPLPPGRASAAARAVLSGQIEQISDVHADPDYAHGAIARLVTYRSIVGVPLLQEGRAIGAIAVARSVAGLFPDRQIELLKTFADQAVIAIQNVRLFQELDARTAGPHPLRG